MAKSKSSKTKKTVPRNVNKKTTTDDTVNDVENDEEDDGDVDQLIPALKESNNNAVVSSSRILLMGMSLVGIGMVGFYYLPGLMKEQDPTTITKEGGGEVESRWIDAFYCSVVTLTTVGFGDICPANPDTIGRIFLTILPLLGLGFFCGPILSMASSWTHQVPGGVLSLCAVTIAIGVSALTALEDMSVSDAIHLCIITGTTVGYGDVTVSTDEGKLFLAVYAILVCGMFGAILDVSKTFLESLCKIPAPKKRRSVKKKKE